MSEVLKKWKICFLNDLNVNEVQQLQGKKVQDNQEQK